MASFSSPLPRAFLFLAVPAAVPALGMSMLLAAAFRAVSDRQGLMERGRAF